MGPQIPRGIFNHDNLTVSFGHEKSKPHNRFTAEAVRVPTFQHSYKEREDAGGGCYYNTWTTVTRDVEYAYIILRDGKVIGWMYAPPIDSSGPLELRSIQDKLTFKSVVRFAESLKRHPEA